MDHSCSLHPWFDLLSLTDASHSWVLFLTKRNQSHKDWIKRKVQGIPESKNLQKNLRVWDTPPPEINLRPREEKCLERSVPEGTEQGQKARSSEFPSWYVAPTSSHSWPQPCLLCVVLPHIPRKSAFSKVTVHTHRIAPAVQPDPSDTTRLCPGKWKSRHMCSH